MFLVNDVKNKLIESKMTFEDVEALKCSTRNVYFCAKLMEEHEVQISLFLFLIFLIYHQSLMSKGYRYVFMSDDSTYFNITDKI